MADGLCRMVHDPMSCNVSLAQIYPTYALIRACLCTTSPEPSVLASTYCMTLFVAPFSPAEGVMALYFELLPYSFLGPTAMVHDVWPAAYGSMTYALRPSRLLCLTRVVSAHPCLSAWQMRAACSP